MLRTQGRWTDMILLVDEAIVNQEAAIRADPTERTYQRFLHNHYCVRAGAQIGLGEHFQVAAAATAIGDRFPNVFDDYLWAERLARCVPLAEKDSHLPQSERDRLAREYADRSIALLRSTQQKNSKDLPKIHTQTAFQPLRGRADFETLLAEVAKPGK